MWGHEHNVTSDGVEVKIEISGRGEAAVAQDAGGQPPAAAQVRTRHKDIVFKMTAQDDEGESARTFEVSRYRCEARRG